MCSEMCLHTIRIDRNITHSSTKVPSRPSFMELKLLMVNVIVLFKEICVFMFEVTGIQTGMYSQYFLFKQ